MSKKNKFATLQSEFRIVLPEVILDIDLLWRSLFNKKHTLEKLQPILLGLADTAGTYGAEDISKFSRELESKLKYCLNKADSIGSLIKLKESLELSFSQLKLRVDKWLSSDLLEINIKESMKNYTNVGNAIYALVSEDNNSRLLMMDLDKVCFGIKHFFSINDIELACKKERPKVIIIDDHFNDDGFVGLDVVKGLKCNIEESIPFIFISNSSDVMSRLDAVRVGVERYFSHPIKIDTLLHTINGLNSSLDNSSFRVLLVDDDESILECYTTILEESGLIVKAMMNPLDALSVINNFKPDVIVVDMYMPDCSGEELVRMIRQNDSWGLIPIIFLSAEQNVSTQLKALSAGAEYFLVKPVQANKLVVTITTVAKNAQLNINLNYDLKISLAKNKNELTTLNQHAIVSTTDKKGNITQVNGVFCETSGYSRAELIGENHRTIKSEKHDGLFFKSLWDTISSGNVWRSVICNQKKSGEEYWLESTIVPFIDDTGEPYQYVSVSTDITALIQSEERLNRSQEFSNIGTWDWNIKSGEIFWSKQIWPLFGYNKKDTETSYDNFIDAVHPSDRQLFSDAVINCIHDGGDYDIEHRVVWLDGSVHWLHESGNTIRNKSGEVLHMLGLVQDITEKKKTEKSLIDARDEAERVNIEKSKFLSSMSHELRTPMNAIMGFSQLLKITKSNPLNNNQENNVDEIMMAGKHLLGLINEVLELSIIESGDIELSFDNVSLTEIINESLQLIQPLAKKRGIDIIIIKNNIPIDMDELFENQVNICLDKIRFKQIMINLLSNAVKYNNENGTITLDCNTLEAGVFRISITDTGNGLSVEKQEKLFIPFNRLGFEQSEIEGAGIGLVLTKRLVKLMGGEINVNSKEGVGSTFWIELPLHPVDHDDNIKKSSSDEFLSGTLHLQDKGNTEKLRSVLYIEDNPANLRLVEQILKCLPNTKMWSAPEALLGIDLVMEHIPDLILLDINLPGMDGYEVINKLRSSDVSRHIPIIAVSANAMPNDIQKGMDAGFNAYITKPVDVKKLLDVVEAELLGNRK